MGKTSKSIHLDPDNIISLLAIYESEWEHRNNMLWSQLFKFFYLSLLIMILPNITASLSIAIPNIPGIIFPIVGILVATFSYVLSLSYSKRLEACSKTYQNIINMLPPPYRRINLENLKHGKYFKVRHTLIIPTIIYIIVLVVGIIIISCYSTQAVLSMHTQ